MSLKQRVGVLAVLIMGTGIGFALGLSAHGTATASQESRAAAANAAFTVVTTEATNLIVTDNRTNILYFYTVDKGQEPGATLKLRGSIDLNAVGKDEIKPTRTNHQP